LIAADELCDMVFQCKLMADPVVACDGVTYERHSIELWMKEHDTSPLTNEPFQHKFLNPNVSMRKQIAAWCEQNGVPVPQPPKPADKQAAAGAGAAAQPPLLQKPVVWCPRHPKEQLRFFCVDCTHGVCVLCAGDSDVCKAHTTKAFDPLLQELKTDREGWASAQEECSLGAEQLCAAIQANADAKVQAISSEAAALQQQVRAAVDERVSAIGAIVLKRFEWEQLVAGAAAHPDVAVKGSAAAAVVVSAFRRPKAPIPPASAAEFRAAASPAAAVGQVIVAAAVVDPEDEAARAAAAAAAISARCIPCGNGALVKGFHGDPERGNHFWQYPEGTKIQSKRWDTYHAASFCSNHILRNNPGPHKTATYQCMGHPPIASPPHVFYNGRCYRTLHEHNPSQVPFSPVKVSEDVASHAGVFCQLPQGFECCPVDSDSLFVCATFPWQSCMLIFAGDASYFTAAGSTWAASTPAGAFLRSF
jgi:hypothetical protein